MNTLPVPLPVTIPVSNILTYSGARVKYFFRSVEDIGPHTLLVESIRWLENGAHLQGEQHSRVGATRISA